MIKLKPNPTFRFTVELSAPGEAEPQTVVFVGRHQGQRALAEWAQRTAELQAAALIDHLVSVLDGWDGVTDDGTAVPWSPEAARQLLDNYPGSPSVVALAYIEQLSAARRKN